MLAPYFRPLFRLATALTIVLTFRDADNGLRAAEANPDAFWVLHQKAKIEKAMGDKTAATASANASLKAAQAANNRDYQMMNEDLLKTLK